MPPVAQEFLSRQRMVVVAASDDDSAMWVTALYGQPGFVGIEGERTVLVDVVPDAVDPLANVLGGERPVGMLALEPATRRRMRVNGTAHRSGAGLAVLADQVYSNCPKYIQTRIPVDVEREATARQHSMELSLPQQLWVSNADTFFVGTYAPGHGADASHRGGDPGFVQVSGPNELWWPEYRGNSMYMTLGNLELSSSCGLLFPDWANGHTLHLSGHARILDDGVGFCVEQVVQIQHHSPLRWEYST